MAKSSDTDILYNLFASIPDNTYVLDMDYKILHVNDAVKQEFPGIELIGRTCFQAIHGREMPCPFCPVVETYRTGQPAQREYFEPRANKHYELCSFPIRDRETGEIIGASEFARDITQRKRIELSFLRSESLLKDLLETLTEGVYLIDTNYTISRANKAMCAMYPHLDPLIGKKCYETTVYGRVCPDCAAAAMFREGTAQTRTFFEKNSDDEPGIWLELTAMPLYEIGSESICGAICIVHNVTPQIEMESQLEDYRTKIQGMAEKQMVEHRLNEAKLRSVLETSGAAISFADYRGRYTYVNGMFKEMLDYSEEDVYGKSITHIIQGDEMDQLDAYEQIEWALSGETERYRSTWQLRTKDKRTLWCDISVSVIRGERLEDTLMISVILDVTQNRQMMDELEKARQLAVERSRELQLSESKMRAVLASSNTPILFTDVTQRIMFANAAMQELIGYDESELIEQNVLMIYVPESLGEDRYSSRRLDIYQGKIDKFRSEVQLRHKNGTKIWTDLNAASIRDEQGNVQSVVTVMLDATENRRILEEQERARLLAEEASSAKSQFLATMSHEIRTPLNGVIGLSDLLLGTELNTKQNEYAQLIKASGKSLLFLINDILDFSKIEAGKLELENEEFDLPNVIESTLGILAARAAEKDLELCATFEHGVPHIVRGDSGRLRQILLNLVGNAVKFTERGGVRIEITPDILADDSWDEKKVIRFSIIDTGIGIPADRMDRLFKSFSQTDSSSARIHGGTGLGLAISLRLVHLMGGEIGVESEFGKGSTFWFYVPFAADEGRGFVPSGLNDRYSLDGVEVLIVEGNETQRQTLARQLAVWGMSVTVAASVAEATETFRNKPDGFRLAMIDQTLGDGNGVDLIRRIRERTEYEQMDTVLLVPLAEEADLNVLQSIRAEHLSKPIFVSALFDTVMSLIFKNEEFRKNDSGILTEDDRRKTMVSNKIHVLVAEDNRINQIVIQNILEEVGIENDVVANGHSACHAVMQGNYDLILMDCQMPEMDGYEATKQIRRWEQEQNRARIPIIALTANATKDDEARCLDAGMDAYCSKPVDARRIVRMIEQQCSLKKK